MTTVCLLISLLCLSRSMHQLFSTCPSGAFWLCGGIRQLVFLGHKSSDRRGHTWGAVSLRNRTRGTRTCGSGLDDAIRPLNLSQMRWWRRLWGVWGRGEYSLYDRGIQIVLSRGWTDTDGTFQHLGHHSISFPEVESVSPFLNLVWCLGLKWWKERGRREFAHLPKLAPWKQCCIYCFLSPKAHAPEALTPCKKLDTLKLSCCPGNAERPHRQRETPKKSQSSDGWGTRHARDQLSDDSSHLAAWRTESDNCSSDLCWHPEPERDSKTITTLCKPVSSGWVVMQKHITGTVFPQSLIQMQWRAFLH